METMLKHKVKIIFWLVVWKFPYAFYFFKNAFQKKNLKSCLLINAVLL